MTHVDLVTGYPTQQLLESAIDETQNVTRARL